MAKKEKFQFGVDFQQLILQLTVTDKVNGLKIIKLYDEEHFTLLQHAIIASLLKKYFKKRKRTPSETVLREQLRLFYQGNKLSHTLQEEDKAQIDRTIREIYSGPVTDADELVEQCVKFARYIEVKRVIEEVDITKYDSYLSYADKLRAANNIGSETEEDDGVFLVAGMKDRAHNRTLEGLYFPTPIRQFNKLLNGHGTTMGNLIMLVSQAKRFKTGAMVNIARGYLRMKKKVLYIDLENGQQALTTRSEQSIIGKEQLEVAEGNYDRLLSKLMRKYKRIGSELVIKRMDAYVTTCNDIQAYIDKLYLKYGIRFDLIMIDYGDLLGAISGEKDETARINAAYVDMKNLAKHNAFEAIYTASHVKREALKHRGTKYLGEDLAKCIDKIRHCDVAIGLQENEEEIEAGMQRWEIIDQRNGAQFGNMLFWIDIPKQRLTEFTNEQIKEYRDQAGETETGAKKKAEKVSDL